MLSRPALAERYTYHILDEKTVFLIAETEEHALHGALYTHLIPCLDGTRTSNEIADLLAGKATRAEIYYALITLERKGFAREALQPAEENLPGVRIVSFGNADAARIVSYLTAAGIQIREDAPLALALTDSYLQPAILEFQREQQATTAAWLLMKPAGQRIWIGPLFMPGETACWECLAGRMRGNRPVLNFIEQSMQSEKPLVPPLPATPASLSLAASLAAVEIGHFHTGETRGRLCDRIVTLDCSGLAMEEHRVVRRPQCPECGDPSQTGSSAEIALQSRKKAYRIDGGHRVADPEETYRRYRHHISPISGAVTSLLPAESADSPLHVCSAGFNRAFPVEKTLDFLRYSLRSASSGKGVTGMQARTSALCEALERYSAAWQRDPAARRARLRDLGDAAIAPRDLLHFSAQQYAGREKSNQTCDRFNRVPEPFDPEETVEWTPVWSLTEQRKKYVPTAYCWYGYPRENSTRFCVADSNGCASGNTLEEAIYQGLMELVERDSVALWWYNQLPRPRVDVESFEDDYLNSVIAWYSETQNRDVWVLDLTHDLGIPSFVAITGLRDPEQPAYLMGMGTHHDPKIALRRSITEMSQMFIWNSVKPGGLAADSTLAWWLEAANARNQPQMAPDLAAPVRTREDFQDASTDDILEDILLCVRSLEQRGHEVLVLDTTQPDVGLPVARVIVPGLRHFWRRLAPGRLYDIPVKLGWLTAPKREEDLNPVSMFL
jgi:ribosomal protein S12 methylthiotransferase accessory factor